MLNERLDETIDRVAAELTAVPPDPAFTTRLRARLDAPALSPLFQLAVPAAVVLATLVGITIALRTTQPPLQREASVVVAPVAAPEVSSPNTAEAPPHAGPPIRTAKQRAARGAERAIAEPSESAVVELTAPHVLRVEDLSVDSLTVAPVELRVLDLASLDVPALDAWGEPKEPK